MEYRISFRIVYRISPVFGSFCTYFQDKADSYDPDHTEDTIHLSEEEMSAFIPLTFNTSIDLRQKLRVRNLIPPSQFQPKSPNSPKSPNNQKLPNSQSSGEEKPLVPKRAKLGGVGPAGDHKVPSLEKDSGKASLKPELESITLSSKPDSFH